MQWIQVGIASKYKQVTGLCVIKLFYSLIVKYFNLKCLHDENSKEFKKIITRIFLSFQKRVDIFNMIKYALFVFVFNLCWTE